MFSKPKYGWSTVTINDVILGSASYIEDVPIYTLETIINYIKGRSHHFELDYDAEGYNFGICEILNELYAFSTEHKGMKLLCSLDPNYEDMSVMETVRKLAKEIHEDFTRDFEDWVSFFVSIDDEYELEDYRQEFKILLNELDELLKKPYHEMEIGNLLFGNSRGEYCLPRGEWQVLFQKFLDICGFDSYGNIEDEELERKYTKTELDEEYHVHFFENELFVIRPYYWGDSEEFMKKHNFIYKPDNLEIDWYKYPLRDSYSNKQLVFEDFYRILQKCAKSLGKELNI